MGLTIKATVQPRTLRVAFQDSEGNPAVVDGVPAKALQGFLAAPSDCVSGDSGPNARANPQAAAQWAYEMADAMLAASQEGASR